MKHFSVFALLSAALPYVAAHGYISKIVIDGKSYIGNQPGNDKAASPIRLISTIDPVKGAKNPDVFCGPGAKLAELVADANPGSTVSLEWMASPDENWPHNTGPIENYLTSTGSTTADKFNSPDDAAWFKVDEAGKKANNPSVWVQQDFMDGKSYTFTLPDDLAAGDYLLRHEIIALHLATQKGGAEFYPGCVQLRVGGNKTGKPSSDETVQFPGVYSDTDPGIFVPNVFDSNLKYDFPGPPIAKLVSSDGDSGDSDSGAPSTSTSASGSDKTSDASSTRTSSASTGSPSPSGTAKSGSSKSGSAKTQCKLKKRANATADDGPLPSADLARRSESAVHVDRPRHFSRVMRRLLHVS